ncbi:S-layer homology domain-containing protein [Paenibacillus sp.]|uniref:S-layer homology domain-containing protein n=1 Tax=Paenibacillus TaxID=44249 RepID=UPI00356969A5
MKLIKKASSIAVASALLLTYAPLAWADEAASPSSSVGAPAKGKEETLPSNVNITKERAIELAKSYIDLPEGYALQSVNLNAYAVFRQKPVPTWNLYYAKRSKDHDYGSINITINGLTGKLTGYSFYNNDPNYKPSYPPKVNFQGAKEIASQWIDKLNPADRKELRYNDRQEQSFRPPLNGDYQYNIRFDRLVGDVPFPQDGIQVSVNGEGQVTGYSYSWTDAVKFEQGVTPIGLEKAAQAFRDKADVSLSYQVPYESRGEKKPLISYGMSTFFLAAAKGEPWSPSDLPLISSGERKPLTDQPLGDAPSASLNLSKEEAAGKVLSVFKLPQDAKLEDASYNEYTNPETGKTEANWNLRWNLAPDKDTLGKGENMVWASVNSHTGEIKNFNRNLYMESSKPIEPKVSAEDASSKAVELVKQQLPAYTHQLVLDAGVLKQIPEERLKNMRTWDVRFNRVIDGVAAGGEGVNISIDRETGDIVNYYFSFSERPYPQHKPDVIALDKAKELLFSQYDIELSYVLDQGITPYLSSGLADKYKLMVASGEISPGTQPGSGTDIAPEAKLVYGLVPKYTREPFFLDAQTGQWRSATTGEPITLEKAVATDIEGHWAQRELQLMLDYQALDVKDGKVNPQQAMTRGEMIKMLVIAMNGGNYGIYYASDRTASFADVKNGSTYFAYVENAVDRGLLDPGAEFNPNAIMTREEMAQLIVRALGYKNLAEYEAVFNANIADAAKLKHIGQVAIVVGLNIMSLTDGSFSPDEEVTRAAAATAFFRYLQKRAELQQPPRYYY